jgi:hypothetical protein
MKNELATGATAVALGLAIVSVASAPASAAIVQWTFQGVLDDGYDTAGEFGAAGTDLTGDAYSLIYTFDTSKGTSVSGPGYQYVFGSSPGGPLAPALLTINGVSATIGAGTPMGEVFTDAGSSVSAVVGNGVVPATPYSYVSVGFDGVSGAPGNLSTPFSSTGTGDICLIGPDSDCVDVDPTTPADLFVGGYFAMYDATGSTEAYGDFDAGTTLITGTVAGVPEPTSWALMTIGFGALGVSLRRRLTKASLAA